jgi:hypothetical protein
LKQLVIRKPKKQLVVRSSRLTEMPMKGCSFKVPKGKYRGKVVFAVKRGFSGWVVKMDGEETLIFNEEIYETTGGEKKAKT